MAGDLAQFRHFAAVILLWHPSSGCPSAMLGPSQSDSVLPSSDLILARLCPWFPKHFKSIKSSYKIKQGA